MEHNYQDPPINNESQLNSQFANQVSDLQNYNTDKNYIVPFSVLVQIPESFQIRKHTIPKLVYNLRYLSLSKETCKKSIEVDNCGYVDVDLYALKIKGCLSFLLNVPIEPTQLQNIGFSDHKNDFIFLSFQDTLYVDHVLKYSVGNLPYYVIDEEHIQLRHIEIEMLRDSNKTAKISGEFYFEYE
ncbi:hypothetical protein ACQCVL_30215 [Bacillus thuringiensis]|uniref:Uncharacterized protein n=1 Tax=Bacillus cereus TaxID=1396 RepID=A0A9W7PZN2_BACCE|nr:hypothetical protein [Bacillus cereus]KAA6448385.1 hypothetical protein DX932_31020 [Bacillus cereus]KAB2500203.1 hypothetical protein F8156_20870 [Bacillus cereus]